MKKIKLTIKNIETNIILNALIQFKNDKLKLNEIKSVEPKEILEKIVIYIKDNGGTCLEDR